MQGLLLVIRVANITENPSPVRGVFNGKYPTGGGVSADVIWGGDIKRKRKEKCERKRRKVRKTKEKGNCNRAKIKPKRVHKE
jgi:hypothetical protein